MRRPRRNHTAAKIAKQDLCHSNVLVDEVDKLF